LIRGRTVTVVHGQGKDRGAVRSRATFGDVFAVGEFRALWFSEVFSVTGDRLALVALTLLVYDRTRSPLLAAAVFAVGYLPYVIGGLFLAELADRRPRRSVMVACDLVRAALVAVMVVPGLPLWVLAALLFTATMFSPVFESARASITPEILQGEHYVLGNAVTTTTILVAEVLGAAAGGVAVAFIGVRPALAIDVATFVLSALLIGLGTRRRPPAARPEAVQPSPLTRLRTGFRVVFGDRALRTLLLFGWLVAFYTIPAGIAAPYVARLGGGSIAIGLVIASTSLGTAIAAPFFSRLVGPRRRTDWMGPLAVLTCVALVLTVFRPGLVGSLVIFSLSAAFGCYQIAANTAFVLRTPADRRAQAFGIASMGVIVGQGAGFLAAGAAAEVIAPAVVVAIGGGLGAVAAGVLTLRWRRISPPGARHALARRLRFGVVGRPASPSRPG
jgi:MFS family permease